MAWTGLRAGYWVPSSTLAAGLFARLPLLAVASRTSRGGFWRSSCLLLDWQRWRKEAISSSGFCFGPARRGLLAGAVFALSCLCCAPPVHPFPPGKGLGMVCAELCVVLSWCGETGTQDPGLVRARCTCRNLQKFKILPTSDITHSVRRVRSRAAGAYECWCPYSSAVGSTVGSGLMQAPGATRIPMLTARPTELRLQPRALGKLL